MIPITVPLYCVIAAGISYHWILCQLMHAVTQKIFYGTQTSASLSKRSNRALRISTNSCAEHPDDSFVNPTMSANTMLQVNKNTFICVHASSHVHEIQCI